MTNKNQILIVFFTLLSFIMFYYLSPILTPFLLGILLAYLTNPLVNYLRKLGLPHLLAVVMVFVIFFLLLTLLLLMLVPIMKDQLNTFLALVPDIMNWIENNVIARLQEYININTIKSSMSGAFSKTGETVAAILASGHSLITIVINVVLTPIVTFYLLKDWDLFSNTFMRLIPKSKKSHVQSLFAEFDETLSVFFRGQLIIALVLSFIYGIGLSLIGLKAGLVVGIVGGMLSIIPYLGSTFVIVVASLEALVQFTTWHSLLLVFVVFLIGQIMEAYVLMPYLVGTRIGLHPVVVIFAVLAGGTLFGFFGVLLAVPAAAVGKVFFNYVNERYLHFV